MEMDENFYKSICRVCLSHENSARVPLFDKSSEENNLSCYGKAVLTFANISLKTDSLPNCMCQNCLYLLKQAIIFKQKCEKSDLELSKLVSNSELSDGKIKEKLSQFVLFKHYFPDECEGNDSENEQEVVPQILKQDNVENSESDHIFDDDFDDLFEYIKEPSQEEKENSKTEENIDLLLDNIEKVIKMSPQSLRRYNKNYHKPSQRIKVKIHSKIKLNRKETKQRSYQNRPQRDITCKICNKVLANISTYQCHMQSHNGYRYVCEHCAKGFAIHAQLQYHQAAVHNIGRTYICKQCGFKAARRWDLVEHERVHSGERPYACDKCGLTFRRRFVWKKHAIYHMEKTIQCPQCPRKFYQRGEMLAHANNVHERVYIYACNVCEVTYAKPSSVRRHLVEKHGVAREMQGKIRRINLGKSCVKPGIH